MLIYHIRTRWAQDNVNNPLYSTPLYSFADLFSNTLSLSPPAFTLLKSRCAFCVHVKAPCMLYDPSISFKMISMAKKKLTIFFFLIFKFKLLYIASYISLIIYIIDRLLRLYCKFYLCEWLRHQYKQYGLVVRADSE